MKKVLDRNLIEGRVYYFDEIKDSWGTFIEQRNGSLFFKPIMNPDEYMEDENGMIRFGANIGFSFIEKESNNY